MNHVFVAQVKNTNVVVELYKKIINEIKAININAAGIKIFLDLKI